MNEQYTLKQNEDDLEYSRTVSPGMMSVQASEEF